MSSEKEDVAREDKEGEKVGNVEGSEETEERLTSDPGSVAPSGIDITSGDAEVAVKDEVEPSSDKDVIPPPASDGGGSGPRRGASRKAKHEGDIKRSLIVRELKTSEDLELLDSDYDDDEDEEEGMYDDLMDDDDVDDDDEAEEVKSDVEQRPPTKVCHVCGHKAQSYASLRTHIMARHEKKKPFLCEICGYAATLETTVERHKRVKHAEGKGQMKYSCGSCDYKCTTPMHLKGHEIIVHTEGATPFECGICAYQCRRKPTVLKHMKYVHEGSKPFTCQHCNRKFPKLCVLNKHVVNVHDKVRPFSCGICHHPFAERRYLDKHVRVVHDKIKDIKCELCDYRCALIYNLHDHMFNKHTRERPHACPKCPEKFVKYGRLAAHLKEKHGEPFRPYKCNQCDYGTDKKQRLNRHKLNEHQSSLSATSHKMIRCKECGARFMGEKRLSAHMANKHDNRKPSSYVVKTPIKHDEKDGEEGGEVVPHQLDQEDLEPALKRPKLEPVFTEGEIPGETIEVVGQDDELWNDVDETRLPLVERRKSIHLTRLDAARMEEEALNGKPVSTKFVVTSSRRVGGGGGGGEDEEPIVFEVEIREEIVAAVSEDRLRADVQAVSDLLQGAEYNGLIDHILSNVNVQENDATSTAKKRTRWPEAPTVVEEVEKEQPRKAKKKMVFLCDECGFSTPAMHTLTMHRTFKHGDQDVESLTTKRCDLCDYTCVHPQHLDAHKQIVHEDGVAQPLSCERCPFQARGEREMNAHLRALHDDVKPFACLHCDRMFAKKSNMVKHSKMVHDKIKPYACDECGRCFADKRDVQSHVDAVHRKLKPFQCHLCDTSCARKSQLKVHVTNVHATQRPIYECGECGQRFINKNLLNLHNKAVHCVSLKAFQCQFCDFSCPTRAMIESHQRRRHTKERVACPSCGVDFMSERKLQAHIRLEHESGGGGGDGSGGNDPTAKNYVCDWCEYAGATQVHLTNHVKSVHENVRRHKCLQCDFTSYATTALKRHISAVHERRKPFGCEECSFRTAYKDSLELHLNNVHGYGPKKLRVRKPTTKPGDDELQLTVVDDGTEINHEIGVITVGETVIVGDVIQKGDDDAMMAAATEEDLMTLVGIEQQEG